VVSTAKELYKIIREKRADYHEKDVSIKKWLLNESIKIRQLYDDPKNIQSDIAKWIEEEESLSQ
jgi:hypothetical protein